METFKEISFKELNFSPFALKTRWALITAGNREKANTMTASWGGFGIMWNKDVVLVGVRPQRYTKEFLDENDTFSLSFFPKTYQKTLDYLGSVSGRDEDKIEKSGLNLRFSDETPYFQEADLVFVTK
jgi:flavin reductase (DIM6/NTAB) family NADH-FMN oxidoreductase RutF